MRYDYVQPFVTSAREILEQVLLGSTAAGTVALSPSPPPATGVAAIVGVMGDESEGRVLYEMSRSTALAIATEMNDEQQTELGNLAKDTLSELASMMTGRAISVLNDQGHRLRVSPPTVITGDNITISNSELETMVVPLSTAHGEVIVNVAMATI